MILYTIRYAILLAICIAVATYSFKIASEFHSQRNPVVIGATISGVANVLCALAIISIYLHAILTGS